MIDNISNDWLDLLEAINQRQTFIQIISQL